MNILCYGDSNTWGFDAKTGERYPRNVRWTGLLQGLMGSEHLIIEEGLNGRTTVFDDIFQWNHTRNGKEYLPTCLMSHKPLDLVIIMLGTNDMKNYFKMDSWAIARGMEALIDQIRGVLSENIPDILILSPPNLSKMSDYAPQFAGAQEKIKNLPVEYKKVAELKNTGFLNITDYITAGDVDGIHIDEAGHRLLAEKLFEYLVNYRKD
ncbi:MAG TPA: hypothetical protein DCG38_08315 [Eubacteriaceae bacterium]|jgi:lysophospholipase L1-like esterase|nr:hypothetical protein [Eubacteriaceae bacterium]